MQSAYLQPISQFIFARRDWHVPFRRACLAAWNDDIYLFKGYCEHKRKRKRERERERERGREREKERERENEHALYVNYSTDNGNMIDECELEIYDNFST